MGGGSTGGPLGRCACSYNQVDTIMYMSKQYSSPYIYVGTQCYNMFILAMKLYTIIQKLCIQYRIL